MCGWHAGIPGVAPGLHPGSDPREGVVQIAGREHAEHLPGGLDKQVLGGRGALHGLDELLARQVSEQHVSRIYGPCNIAYLSPLPSPSPTTIRIRTDLYHLSCA